MLDAGELGEGELMERAQVMVLFIVGECPEDEGFSIIVVYDYSPQAWKAFCPHIPRHRSPPFSADLLSASVEKDSD